MIPCKHCNTPNSLDSTFCKRCGTGLPEDEIGAAKLKLEKIVEEGVLALNLGKLAEAMAIAETAVTSDPSMASGYLLKSNTHERRGEIAEALECAERLVELNPDSELDKIKRNQLRAALGASALKNQAPSRVLAAVAAASCMVICVCGAVILMQKQTDGRVAYSTPKPESPTLSPTGPNGVNPNPAPSSPGAGSNPGTQNPQPTPNVVKPDQAPTEEAGSQDTTSPTPSKKSDNIEMLPGADGSETTHLEPIDPGLPPSKVTAPDPSATKPKSPVRDDIGPSVKPEQSKPDVDPGVVQIEISPSRPGDRKGGNSGSAEMPKDLSKVYMKMGNDYYLQGNYSGAAASLLRAVNSGADPVIANQRLAQTYISLGKNAEAADAYKRAISAASSSLGTGKGDSAKLRAIRDACETALKQIQGG